MDRIHLHLPVHVGWQWELAQIDSWWDDIDPINRNQSYQTKKMEKVENNSHIAGCDLFIPLRDVRDYEVGFWQGADIFQIRDFWIVHSRPISTFDSIFFGPHDGKKRTRGQIEAKRHPLCRKPVIAD